MLYQLSYTPKSVVPSENQVGVYLLTFAPQRKREVKIFVTNQQLVGNTLPLRDKAATISSNTSERSQRFDSYTNTYGITSPR